MGSRGAYLSYLAGVGLALAALTGVASGACNPPVGTSITCTGGPGAAVSVRAVRAAPESAAPGRTAGRVFMEVSPVRGGRRGRRWPLCVNLDLPEVKRGYVRRLLTFCPEWGMVPG